MSALYLFGILMGILVAFLYRGTLFQGEPVPFVMELPNYRLPGAKKCRAAVVGKGKRLFTESIHCDLHCHHRGMVPAEL